MSAPPSRQDEPRQEESPQSEARRGERPTEPRQDERPPPAETWHTELWRDGPTFGYSSRRLVRHVLRPLADLLRIEATSSIVLLIAAVLAVGWANSPWSATYAEFWSTRVSLGIGPTTLSGDLRGLVNDGLMTIFFLAVGLEVKYELVHGHLRDLRTALVPVLAAAGGMLVPALVYLLVVGTGEGSSGWGIPMATDIAFAVGVLGLLGSRIPRGARLFLLTLAIADDIGAIVVIAVFYAAELVVPWLVLALLAFAGIVLMRRLRIWSLPLYGALGLLAWFATYRSGVHPTIAGVVCGLLTPAAPLLYEARARHLAATVLEEGVVVESVRRVRFLLHESIPVVVRLQRRLLYVSGFGVLPVFALANAGVTFDLPISAWSSSRVALGVAAGLLLGKAVGIGLASWLAIRSGYGRLPPDTSWPILIGVGILGGVGFTVAMFITELSFAGTVEADEAKVGIMAASVLAAAIGLAYLRLVTRRR